MPEKIDFQGETVFRLKRGDNEILIAPQYGARLLKWKAKGRDIIYWPEEVNWFQASKIRGGNPILFPFVGRVSSEDRQGVWKDEDGTLYPMQQHGFCRDAEFFFIQEPNDDEFTIRMRLEASQGTRKIYPFDFTFDVIYQLLEDELVCTFKIHNGGQRDMLYYAGHHFYFAMNHQDRADWQLHLPCQQWARHLPEGEVVYEFATQETTTFADKSIWNRIHVKPAHEIVWENPKIGQKLAIEMERGMWPVVTTWAEFDESDYYCVEPWQAVPNAIESGKYLRLLPSGKHETATCKLKVLQ